MESASQSGQFAAACSMGVEEGSSSGGCSREEVARFQCVCPVMSIPQADRPCVEEYHRFRPNDDANACQGLEVGAERFDYLPLVEEGLQLRQVASGREGAELNLLQHFDDNSFRGIESFEGRGSHDVQVMLEQINLLPHAGHTTSIITTEESFNLHQDHNVVNPCQRVETSAYTPMVEDVSHFNQVSNGMQAAHSVDLALSLGDDASAFQGNDQGFQEEDEEGGSQNDIEVMLQRINSSPQVRHSAFTSVDGFNLLPHASEVNFTYTAAMDEALRCTSTLDALDNVNVPTGAEVDLPFSSQLTGAEQTLDNHCHVVESFDYVPVVGEGLQINQGASTLENLNASTESENCASVMQEDSSGCITQVSAKALELVESFGSTVVVEEEGSQSGRVAHALQAVDEVGSSSHQERDASAGEESFGHTVAAGEDVQVSPVVGVEHVTVSPDFEPRDGSAMGQEGGNSKAVVEAPPRGDAQKSVNQPNLGNGIHVTAAKGAGKVSPDAKSTGIEGQQEGGVPVWVKWRGKWQAGIRCWAIDCPSATLKLKPNYSKKKHVVVYFPLGRIFSWVDTQHICPISGNPWPLLSGNHASGRETVKDKNLPRRRMLLKLGGDMLDISDRLHIKAVVESSQNVNVWKTFAREAAAATKYSELGTLLVRLHLTIAPLYIKPLWMERRYALWKEDCGKAASAEMVQKLTKELINAVMWDEVAPLWNAPEQPELDPEWKHWKGDEFEEKDSEDDPDTNDSSVTVPENRDVAAQGTEQLPVLKGCKRFKDQARARHQTSNLQDGSQHKRVKVNPLPSVAEQSAGATFGHAVTAFRSPLVYPVAALATSQGLQQAGTHNADSVVRDKPSQTPVATRLDPSNLENVRATASTSTSGGPEADAYYSGLCSAFLKKKSRRCHRQAKEDMTYCGKHKYLGNPENHGKVRTLESGRNRAWESGLCSAYLSKERARCTLPTTGGSFFCGVHVHLASKRSAEKNGEMIFWARQGSIDTNGGPGLTSPFNEPRCTGITTRGLQCTHKPQYGTSYCVKHSNQGTTTPDAKEDGNVALVPTQMDWQHAIENRIGSAVQVQVGQTCITPHANFTALGNGLVQARVTSSAELLSVQNSVPKKKKWVSNLMDNTPGQIVQPVLADGQGMRCISRTTRNDEQCSFRARAGHVHCTKHLIAIQSQRSGPSEDADVVIPHGAKEASNNSISGAKDLFARYFKAAEEGTFSSEAHDPEFRKQLLNWTRTEAAKDYSTAKELLKVVTEEMSRLQTILQPIEAAEEDKIEVKQGMAGSENCAHVTENGNKDQREADEKDSAVAETSLRNLRRRKRNGRLPKLAKKENNEKDTETEKEALLLRMKTAVRTVQIQNLRQMKQTQSRGLYTLTKGGRMVPYDDVEESKCPVSDDDEILDTAKSSCCALQFIAKMEQKSAQDLQELFVRLWQLCCDRKVPMQWLADNYECPSGCQRASTTSKITSRTPLKSEVPDVIEEPAGDVELGKRLSNSEQADCKPNSSTNTVILWPDLSDCKEPVPVVCSVDQVVVDSWTRMHGKDCRSSSETFRPWETFNYITKRVLDPSLGLDPENYKVGCSCEESLCSPQGCDHVRIFDIDNVEACDIYGKPMKGRFPYDEQGCIILEEGYLVYECNSSCRCSGSCQNRVLQKGVTVKLEVFRTLDKGWAVKAAQMIPRGTFVCEYVGEVLQDQEANKRGERYDQVGCSYLYDIDAHLDTSGKVNRSKPFVIDATKHGNVARFINHSCAPNLVNYQVLVDSMDCQLAHIGLFASRDIQTGEELAYDYRYRLLPGRGCPCHCGAPNCRGRLY